MWIETDMGSCWWWSSGHSADGVDSNTIEISPTLSSAASFLFSLRLLHTLSLALVSTYACSSFGIKVLAAGERAGYNWNCRDGRRVWSALLPLFLQPPPSLSLPSTTTTTVTTAFSRMAVSIFQLAVISILLSSRLTNAQSSITSTPVPSLLPSPSVTLVSTDSTAVPLSQIGATEPASPTPTLTSTPAPGSTPTGIPNAPPLPDRKRSNAEHRTRISDVEILVSSVHPSDYPKLDTVPPTDSPEVAQWIAEVQASGIQIPTFNPTVAGGCPTNPDAAADASRCWWTCGGCVGPSDVSSCPTKNTWGLTYDDGPAFYTPNLLHYLDEHSLKSTFFVIGSRAVSSPALLQSEYMSGHHISVHTWSHAAPLTTLTNEQIIAELGWSKKIIKAVLGVTPNTMRPPYGDIDNRVRAISLAMGLIPIMWTRISATSTFDTGGAITTLVQLCVT